MNSNDREQEQRKREREMIDAERKAENIKMTVFVLVTIALYVLLWLVV